MTKLHGAEGEDFVAAEMLQITTQVQMETDEARRVYWLELFSRRYLRRTATAAYMMCITQLAGAGVIQSYQSLFYAGLGFGSNTVLLITGIYGIMGVVGQGINLFWVADRWPRVRTMGGCPSSLCSPPSPVSFYLAWSSLIPFDSTGFRAGDWRIADRSSLGCLCARRHARRPHAAVQVLRLRRQHRRRLRRRRHDLLVLGPQRPLLQQHHLHHRRRDPAHPPARPGHGLRPGLQGRHLALAQPGHPDRLRRHRLALLRRLRRHPGRRRRLLCLPAARDPGPDPGGDRRPLRRQADGGGAGRGAAGDEGGQGRRGGGGAAGGARVVASRVARGPCHT
ncbi:hypothetical protein VTK73DRAFT_2683 [Phialemonium thermophilum]|uniref:Uncharacterized protein n=1 Tax=Phialemonium thermophilum TaxID=223376 RepID=A0ABR3VQA7_9PEZI